MQKAWLFDKDKQYPSLGHEQGQNNCNRSTWGLTRKDCHKFKASLSFRRSLRN